VIPLRPADIAEAVAGEPLGVPDEALKASSITSVTVDSRQVVPGTLFVAVAGERVDGHDFAAEAVAAGAVLILCARPLHDEVGTPLPCVVVKDPVQALGALASWYCTGIRLVQKQ